MENIKALKQAIKTLSENQKAIKPQRKTEHFTGTRTIPAWKATSQHLINRYDLRHMYIAYGFMRGKSFEQIEPKAKTQYDTGKVSKIMEHYETVCVGA